MVSLSYSRLPAVDIGTNVVVRVPELDRGRLAPRNVLVVVVDVNSVYSSYGIKCIRNTTSFLL
jgi:hypothetical protein